MVHRTRNQLTLQTNKIVEIMEKIKTGGDKNY